MKVIILIKQKIFLNAIEVIKNIKPMLPFIFGFISVKLFVYAYLSIKSILNSPYNIKSLTKGLDFLFQY
ncbi:hypothetical protein SDC9_164469 [bioreactor metagenome]|uniref:Uncharacterized protein n=1 Tax=bioreactor metagenome TaxID=1076179 RepID=A0A645FUD7_9ZZZZ